MNTNGVVLGEYAYDAFNRRVRKTVSGKITLFHYDFAGNLISETDQNGIPQRNYIYFNGEPVAMKIYTEPQYSDSTINLFRPLANSLAQP